MPPRSSTSTRHAPSQQPEQRRVLLDHPQLEAVDVLVRRHRRTRHVRLHVDEHGAVTASVPMRFPAARLDPIVRERGEWLYEVIARMQLKARDTQVDIERGDPIRWLGRWIPVELQRTSGRRSTAQLQVDAAGVQQQLLLRVPDGADAHDALVAWYRREARTVFEARVEHWCQALGIRAGKVSVREQRTRWGSCSSRGDLSFNWRLVLAPAWVLDSIVVHELCHIEELNHSDAFWALLDARFPHHAEASAWLREHGSALRVTRPDRQDGSLDQSTMTQAPASQVGLRPRGRRRSAPTGAAAAEQFSLFDV